MTYEPKEYDEIKEEIVLNLIQNVDSIVDVNEGSVLDIFSSSFATEFENIYEDLEDINDSLKISTATGADLDEIGEAAGIDRLTGTAATCEVSFIRTSVATSDFVINQGSLVSTNPNGDTVINFSTNEATTFYTDVTGLSVDYYNGLVYYKLNNRKFSNISISGFTENTDYEIEENYNDELVDSSTFELLDNCNATTDWTAIGDAASITNNSTYYQQYDKSLNLLKTATTSVYFGYDKTLSSSSDIENKQVFVCYRIKDATAMGKIVKISFLYGSSSTDTFQFDFVPADLETGGSNGEWPRLKLDYNSADSINGNPDISAIDYLKVYIEVSATSDTIAASDILMDFWFAGSSETYYGDVIKWLQTDDSDATLTVSYKPLSYEIDCTATTIGSSGNVSIGEVNFKVSTLNNINTIFNFTAGETGSDEELDFTYRERIKSAADLRGASTVPAIEAAVKELSYVKDCVVIDTPLENIASEKHTYDDSLEKFHLNYEQALDNANLTISGYTRNTDFQLNTSTNEVEFGIGGTDPANDEVLDVSYDVNRLGKIKILVTGTTGALTTTQLSGVDEVAETEVSAGISYTISAPTYTSTNVSATVNVNTNYNSTDVQTAVENMITSVFNVLDIGQDLLISDIISAIRFVPGVLNVTSVQINGGTSDLTADDDEIFSEGTVTITTA